MKKLVIVLMSIVLLMSLGVVQAKEKNYGKYGKFEKLKFYPGLWQQPAIAISDNELLFLGGHQEYVKEPITAKIYNIDTKELKDLDSSMNVPRAGYSAIKYDDSHVLLYGGEPNEVLPVDVPYAEWKKYAHIVEIYDIKANKFTRIQDTKYLYGEVWEGKHPEAVLLADGRILLSSLSKNKEKGYTRHYEVFNPKTKKITEYKPKNQFPPEYGNSGGLVALNNHEVLLYNDPYEYIGPDKWGDFHVERRIEMYILDIDTGNVTQIKGTDDFFGDCTHRPHRVDKNTLLFAGVCRTDMDMVELDIPTRTFKNLGIYPKDMSYYSVLLDNGNLLFLDYFWGYYTPFDIIDAPLFLYGEYLHYALYDYKNNKVYKYKKSYYLESGKYSGGGPYTVKLKNAVYINGNKFQLYRYNEKEE